MSTLRTVPLHRITGQETGPPRLVELPDGTPVWLVTRYDDVHQVLNDQRFGRAPVQAPGAPPVGDSPSVLKSREAIGRQDGGAHLRLRRAVGRAFTPRAVAHLRPWVADVIEQLLDGLVKQGPPGDLVRDYAMPLPSLVMHRLLAVEDVPFETIFHWSQHAMAGASAAPEEGARARTELAEFAGGLLAARREAPGDDLVSSVVVAAQGEGGIPESALVNLISTMIIGGHDTTMTMLGNSLLYLLTEQPVAWQRLRTGEEAAAALVERLLHLIPIGDPAEGAGHLVTAGADIGVGGVTIPAGALVSTDRLAAHHDPAAFPGDLHDPEALFAPLPRPTLAFGAGRHYCVGTWLARAELQLGLHRLAVRLPRLRLAVEAEEVEWRHGSITRSPVRLPASW
ncbi:cytochrome P450 [Streptomyces sp. NPDC088923]|uniref:cytochrome P450 n=1 Tax=Streptomyces sp. NPDC088923 TaxID=3365913 RepID=UPI00380D7E12